MSWSRATVVVLACTAALTCAWVPSGSAQTPASVIAFDGDGRIHTVDPDGPGVAQEIVPADEHPDAGHWAPDLSPDGAALAFARVGEDNDYEIWTMGADGSDPAQLTDGPAIDTDPDWSPDGTRIAFARMRSGTSGRPGIYVMASDGAGVRRIVDDFRYVGKPEWSPNGRRIAFSAQKNEDWDVYSVRADGSRLRRVTRRFGNDLDPSWSPDGSRIAFAGYHRASRTFKSFVVEIRGGDVTRLALDGCAERCWVEGVAWSPDGTRLAVSFSHFEKGASLVTVDLATGAQELILTRAEDIRSLSWSS
ncbi:MAG TPA: hypothetical protein VEU29_03535 [Actinomycetota bacterium]|nr:hypothetical protein [Actinomycetota bacterium]